MDKKTIKLTYLITVTSKEDVVSVVEDIESEFSMFPKEIEYNGNVYENACDLPEDL